MNLNFNKLFKLPTGSQELLKLIYLKSKPNFISSRSKRINYSLEEWILDGIFNFAYRELGEFNQKLKEGSDIRQIPEINLVKLEKLIKENLIIDHIPDLQNIIEQQGMDLDQFFNYLMNPPEPLLVRENPIWKIRIRTMKRDNFLTNQFFKRNKNL